MTKRYNQPDAERFLSLLDPNAEADAFTFQVFDDDKERERQRKADYKQKHGNLKKYKSPFAKIYSGPLAFYWKTLTDWNDRGAGIFVTINATNLKGRTAKDIVRIRALFIDLDGAPLEPILTEKELPAPHIIVETSPGRWHAYWLINGMEPRDFEAAQRILIARYNSDKDIHDLPRVMRVPGFWHKKTIPSLVRIHSVDEELLPYKAVDFLAKLTKLAPPPEQKEKKEQKSYDDDDLNSVALKNLNRWVPKLFPDAISYRGGYRVTSAMLGRDLEEDLSLMPDGIKDFGVHDQPGELREGKRTAIDIVMQYGKKNFPAACDWLCEQLGLPNKWSGRGVALKDFRAYMPMHSYIFTPSREMWPAGSVNARIPPVPLFKPDGRPDFDDKGNRKTLPASAWLDRHQPVEQMTWAPGLPMLIEDRLIAEGGWIERARVTCFNLYRPPITEPGDAKDVRPWLDHVGKVYGSDRDHIVGWLAHRKQKPQEKINHALVLGGLQGIGKDTLLAPVKYAIGPWNFSEVSPIQALGRFNGFVKSIILRISEARDLGDVDRYQFYDHSKSYTAAPPDVLRVDEKHLREHAVLNCCGVVITTNHKSDGIYLPADDRRHYVAWSDLNKEDFTQKYWNNLWHWYADCGFRNVAAYLAAYDLKDFDPKAPPPKTAAFWDIVDASRAPEDAELADVLDEMGEKKANNEIIRPEAVTLAYITAKAEGDFKDWITDRKNRRAIPHRLETNGYVPVRNGAAKDGLWKVGRFRQVIYARKDLSLSERLKAAQTLVDRAAGKPMSSVAPGQ